MICQNLVWVEAKLAASRHPKPCLAHLHRAYHVAQSEGRITQSVSGTSVTSGLLPKFWKLQRLDDALLAVELMQKQGMPMSADVIYCLLRRCTKKRDFSSIRRVHALMISSQFDLVGTLGDHLIRLFASCGSLLEASLAFCRVTKPSVYTWHAIISAHIVGETENALQLYHKMQPSGIQPDKFVLSSVLKACGIIEALQQGMSIHQQIAIGEFNSDLVVANSLIDMYGKCGCLDNAQKVFDKLLYRDIFSWTVIIAGYVQHGHAGHALKHFVKMQEGGIRPNKVTLSCAVKACLIIGVSEHGKLIHDQILRSGLESDLVISSTLVDMYAKSGSLEEAQKVFDNMPNQDVVSWGAMIDGYALHGHGLSALKCFEKVQQDKLKPDKIMHLCLFKACSSIGALGQGKVIHDQVIRSKFEGDSVFGGALVEMYAKCGSLNDACRVFNRLPNQNMVSWGAMIAAYAQHGNCKLALECLEEMQQQGLGPDGWIYSTIISACCHAGKVEEGHWYFKSMQEDHRITPTMEHFNCMVDLFCRAGYLDEAEGYLKTMPEPPNINGWTSLLTASRMYGNMELGRRCFEQAVRLDADIASVYVLMTNIYTDAGMLEDAHKIHTLRKCATAEKKPGRAWVEINNRVHEFFVGGITHPQSENMYMKLRELGRLVKEEGYEPQLNLVLETASEEVCF